MILGTLGSERVNALTILATWSPLETLWNLVIPANYCLTIVFITLQDEANESRMRAACLIEEVQRLLDRQSGLYSVYSDAIHKFKSSKDATAFANARKKLDGDYRSISNQISQVQSSLTKEQPESAEKVRSGLLVFQ